MFTLDDFLEFFEYLAALVSLEWNLSEGPDLLSNSRCLHQWWKLGHFLQTLHYPRDAHLVWHH